MIDPQVGAARVGVCTRRIAAASPGVKASALPPVESSPLLGANPPRIHGTWESIISAPQAEEGDAPHSLEHDAAAHLGRAADAVVERDRDLDDLESGPLGAVGGLDLERVPLGRDRVRFDRLEYAAAEALEAAGRVLDAHVQEERRVERPAARDRPPGEAPVAD